MTIHAGCYRAPAASEPRVQSSEGSIGPVGSLWSQPWNASQTSLSEAPRPTAAYLPITITRPDDIHVYIYEVGSRRPPAPVTFAEGLRTIQPIWSPDGTRLIYGQGSPLSLQSIPTDLSGLEPQTVFELPAGSFSGVWATSFSPDGGELIFQQVSPCHTQAG